MSKMNAYPDIVYNGAKCLLCNDIIESRSVNHYVECSCKNIAIDGGKLYATWSCKKPDSIQSMILYSDDDFEKIRIFVKWGTYGESGKEVLEYIPLALLTDKHIDAIIEYHGNMRDYNPMLQLIEKEKLYRKMNKDEIQSSI